ncbi:ATPase, T2SS/T4P/T4SS family [Bacillus alkalicellulosilyticus]|uniref:ATPase, T2SS/T4P/T4SS family n=1 Tax=Alkalihalobacterium alkalicellulosilyticum TaxID=1912214 RepID=UPI0009975BCB|nr:ATPase, T2SS/T4P/T4SS family [Bacillus alkalicellulosilyticus]
MSAVLDKAIEDIESQLGLKEEPFDPSKWLSETIAENGLEQNTVTTFERKKSFTHICKTVREVLDKNVDIEDSQSSSGKAGDQWLNLVYRAVIGDEQAMAYIISKITEVLRNQNITSTDYPTFYDSLGEAIFHEVWGVSVLHKWDKYPNSEAAVIRGTELWMDIKGKFVKQEEEFENKDVVERVKRAFVKRTKDAVINEQNPELEIEREDGSRITMIQKPRARDNYIMFRRFIVKDITLYEQARLKTIRDVDIPIFQALSRTMCNIIFAGRVRSAKSTFMKSMLRERDPSYVMAVMEKHFELQLSEQMKDRLCFEIQAKEGDLHKAVPRLLRMEHDFIVVGEIRSLETEGYLQACERGERGAVSTYHLTTVEHVAPQITRHILDEFPNRNYENELERVARNIDIIITMSADRDRRKKRVIGVTEVLWDEENKTYGTQDLIRYSPITKTYYYSANLSKTLLHLMAEENLEETKTLVRLLRQREQESPMSDYDKIADNLLIKILEEDVNE